MPIPWNEDPAGSAPILRRNLEALLRGLIAEAADRVEPTVDIARQWHRRIFAGVDLPVAYYAGEIRDDDPRFPELVGYEVTVGSRRAVPARRVPQELARFEERLQRAVAILDRELAPGTSNLRPDSLPG